MRSLIVMICPVLGANRVSRIVTLMLVCIGYGPIVSTVMKQPKRFPKQPKTSGQESAQRTVTATTVSMEESVTTIYSALQTMYGQAACELNFDTPFQLLVATVLSAQTTDVRVNSVTPELFARFGTPQLLAQAPVDEVASIIKSIGFYRVKAASIITLSQQLIRRFDGHVPSAIEDLIQLQGVGRKTANVVRGDAFGLPGLTIDTHCGRLARRFGWSVSKDPVVVEADLAAIVPQEIWTPLSHVMIFHGRRICHSRTPGCGSCYLAPLCPSVGLGPMDPQESHRLVKGPERDHLLQLVEQNEYVGIS